MWGYLRVIGCGHRKARNLGDIILICVDLRLGWDKVLGVKVGRFGF